jgi:2-amino-4-hydroxy-6-hydroxymethyldihydropteridine diphosphokinase
LAAVVKYIVALGSNMGDRAQLLREAVDAFGDAVRSSLVYETDPQGGPTGQSRYLNMAIAFDSETEPLSMLARCQQLEERFGRVRTVRNGPRTLDIDIVSVDRMETTSDRLTLPHPRAAERLFVICPVGDVDPDTAHWIRHRAGLPRFIDELSPPRPLGALSGCTGGSDLPDVREPLSNRND